jgi:type IV secretory pathway VirB2 component (pilin)
MTAKTEKKKKPEQYSKGKRKTLNLSGVLLVLGVLLQAPLALALPGGLGSIETKADEIKILVIAVAAIIVAIGAVWCGLKFIKGDPDSWGYVWKFALGAIIVYAAPEIVMWLAG